MTWGVYHSEIIKDFVMFLNSKSRSFVLKGDTSLMLCYGSTRFSEDVDLDSTDKGSFFKIIKMFVEMYSNKYVGISYRNVKDTDTVKRAFIYYGGAKPLKVEVSYRNRFIDTSAVTIINGILVYNINWLFSMKVNAFTSRDKIRDLYDVVFIFLNYRGKLSADNISFLRNTLIHGKSIEYVDYLLKTQKEDFIDFNALLDGFMTMYHALGLV